MPYATVSVGVPGNDASLTIRAFCTYEGTAPSWGWDGGDPGDPPEWEIESVTLDDSAETEVSPEWVQALGLSQEVEDKLAQCEVVPDRPDY